MNYRISPTGQKLAAIPYTTDRSKQELLTMPIGRWGRLWQEWVKTEYPTEIAVLIMEGRWQLIPREIDREAQQRWDDLDTIFRQKNPRPMSFTEIQTWSYNFV